jgi:hypothetical protein
MGADLIGFIAVGPATFTEDQTTKARKTFEAERTRVEALCAESDDAWEVLSDDDCQIYYALRAFKDSDEFFTALKYVWEEFSGRDVAGRMYNGKQIVFAGDMSWGDTPDGIGYNVLRVLMCTKVGDDLGIE